jgi:hypothetical protein
MFSREAARKKFEFLTLLAGGDMSVLKNKRGLSSLEFYHNARKLRKDITTWLLRDFGVRDKVRIEKRPDGEPAKISEEYPEWLIAHLRDKILLILHNMMMNIIAANTIYPITFDELALRRRYQTGAVINCEQLIQEIEYCEDILPLELSKFEPYIAAIEYEIKLLKGWRKANNKIAEKIKESNEKK